MRSAAFNAGMPSVPSSLVFPTIRSARVLTDSAIGCARFVVHGRLFGDHLVSGLRGLLSCLLCRSGVGSVLVLGSPRGRKGSCISKNRHAVIFFFHGMNWNFAPSRVRICRFCPCSLANSVKNGLFLSLVRFGRLERERRRGRRKRPHARASIFRSRSCLFPPGASPPLGAIMLTPPHA